MHPHRFSRSLLVVIALVLSSIAPHLASARPNPTPTAQCSSVPCGGSCVIAPSCAPAGPCPQYLILGHCTQDTGTCRCVPGPLPVPTPMPSQCSGASCGGSCTFVTPPFPCPQGEICNEPNLPILPGECEMTAAGCDCVPLGSPTPTPTPTPTTCVDNVLCIRGSHWSPTACQCVPDIPEPTATPTVCVDNVLCIRGTHWSPTACQCVRDRGPHTPHALSGFHSPHTIQAPHQPHTPG
jgi:hypothetical protein